MDVYKVIEAGDLKRSISVTDNLKYIDEISEREVRINEQMISGLNLVQYAAFRYYYDRSDYWNQLLFNLIKKANIETLQYTDNFSNNLLNYLNLIGSDELIEEVLKRGIKSTTKKINETTLMLCVDPASRNKKEKIENYNKTTIQSMVKQDKIGEYKIYHFDIRNLISKKVHEFSAEEVYIKKFPGRLYITIDKISGIVNYSKRIKSLIVSFKKNEYVNYTEAYDIINKAEINDGETLFIPFEDEFVDLSGKIYACSWDDEVSYTLIKVGMFKVPITKAMIESCHNNPIGQEITIQPYKGIIRSFTTLFSPDSTKAEKIILKMTYISEEELKYIEAPLPNDTKSLLNWILIKKISAYLWFKGFCHIKNTNSVLWKRRMIHWQGVHLMIYNEYSGKGVGDLIMTRINKEKITKIENERYISIYLMNDEKIEMYFDYMEGFKKFVSSLDNFLGS